MVIADALGSRKSRLADCQCIQVGHTHGLTSCLSHCNANVGFHLLKSIPRVVDQAMPVFRVDRLACPVYIRWTV